MQSLGGGVRSRCWGDTLDTRGWDQELAPPTLVSPSLPLEPGIPHPHPAGTGPHSHQKKHREEGGGAGWLKPASRRGLAQGGGRRADSPSHLRPQEEVHGRRLG